MNAKVIGVVRASQGRQRRRVIISVSVTRQHKSSQGGFVITHGCGGLSRELLERRSHDSHVHLAVSSVRDVTAKRVSKRRKEEVDLENSVVGSSNDGTSGEVDILLTLWWM